MGRPFRVYLSGDKVYSCGACRTHLASNAELVSKHFHSKSGRAYLFQSSCNVVCGPHEHRIMTTGKHIVCDIFCVECMSCVGWQYIFAFEESQKYKEGMCILERAMVVDFEKTSHAASLARASLSLSTSSSVSSGSSPTAALAGASSGELHQQQHHHHLQQQHLQQQQQQQQARMLLGGGLSFHHHLPMHQLVMDGVGGPGLVLFAADDSGSEDEE